MPDSSGNNTERDPLAIQFVPFALQNAAHSAALFRQSASAPFATGGILAAGELALSQQGTPNMSIVLGAGRAKVVGNSVSPPAGLSFTTQAMYDTLNDAPLTLTLTASNATNPRIDAAWVQIQDSFYSGAANTAVPGVTAGVPAPSPVAPAIPTNAQLIGYIAVGANVTTIVAANISFQAPLAQLIAQRTSINAVLARASNFSVGTVSAAVPFDSAPVLNGLAWVIGSPTRITCVTAGLYLLSGDWSVNSTGTATYGLRKNGSLTGNTVTVTNASGAAYLPAAFPVEMVAGDYVEVMVSISTGTQPWLQSSRVNASILSFR